MKTLELHHCLTSNPITSVVYGGIFPRNVLPKYVRRRKPRAFIANTHLAHQKGQHWIAFYFKRNGTAVYFDSYGLPPTIYPEFVQFLNNNSTSFTYNTKRVQGNDKTCGMYCLYFIMSMTSTTKTVKMFKHLISRRPFVNDQWIRKWVKNTFNIKK